MKDFHIHPTVFSIILMLVLSSCATPHSELSGGTPDSAQLPGNTFANFSLPLHSDIMRNLADYLRANEGCDDFSVILTEHLGANGEILVDATRRLMSGVITEKWTIEQCSRSVQYLITITPDGAGGTFVALAELAGDD